MANQNERKKELQSEMHELLQENASLKEELETEFKISNKKIAHQEKEERAAELVIANKELIFQNDEKEKRAAELAIANKELIFQNDEKEKRAAELVIANKELVFQNDEKEKRAAELVIANKELVFQNDEKEKRAAELVIANKELVFQNDEKEKRAAELVVANKELAFQNDEKEKRAAELVITKKELAFKKELDGYRSEKERLAHELTLLIDTANAPIFGINANGKVNEWNQKSAEITGFKKEEVLGKDLVETYITEDYRDAVKLVLDNALKGKETANYEFPLFTKDDKRVMVLLNSSTRRNVEGEIVGVLGVGQDISEIDKLRTESESVAKELRQFIETANAPIFGIDSKGLVNEWNETSEKITGFKKEEVLGKDLVETYITEDYRDAVKLVLDNALKGKETANYEFPLFTKDDKRVMVLLNSSTRRNVEGEIVGVLGVGQDITILNEYKENLEYKVKIRTQELAFQNDEKDKRAAELVIANKELAFQNDEKEKRSVELGIANKELEFQNNEKEKRELELVNAKEKAEESDWLKTAFLANMSHEIRTPMNGILGFSELLKTPNLSGEEQQDYIRIIEKSGHRMLNTINDIISISKIESGLMEVNMKEANINEQIDFVYSFFKPEVEGKGMNLLIKKPLIGKEAFIQSDSEKIYGILTNLVKNAIKFTKEGTIELGYILKTGSQPAELEFYVKDTGIGIPKDRQLAIFDRFIQADISGKMAYQGAGLGLSISKAYVELLGGKIWVESEEGKGTILYFTLPYQTENKEENIPEIKTNHEVSGLKILIAEDDEMSAMFLSIIVKGYSEKVFRARTGNEAIEICRNNPDIGLILMDIQMPELNGDEVTRQIRKFNKDVIIIAQTGLVLSTDKEGLIKSGCNDYISKPINKDELFTLIQKYFKK